jgi:hypothetical protein
MAKGSATSLTAVDLIDAQKNIFCCAPVLLVNSTPSSTLPISPWRLLRRLHSYIPQRTSQNWQATRRTYFFCRDADQTLRQIYVGPDNLQSRQLV